MPDGRMVVQLTVAELRELVRDEVVLALGEFHEGAQPEPLIGLQSLCKMLSCSPATVTRLVREGLPTVRLGGPGGERRWIRERVIEWLETREKGT